MALSKDDIIKIVNGFLELIRQKHDVRQAYLFGSWATGKTKAYSDVDLALVLGAHTNLTASLFSEDFEIFHEAQKYNSLLEVISFIQKDFDESKSTLVRKIKKEGIRLF